jgi:hypothetical protein
MAYTIQGYTQTSEVQGGTKIVKIREYHVYSLPSNTYFQFRRPLTTTAANIKSVAQQLSDRIEAVLALPDVIDVAYSQDVTASGQLVDMMTTYYATPDGMISGSVQSDLAHFGPNYTGNQVQAEIAAGGDYLGS